MFGVAVVTLLTALPRTVVTAVAGLALSGTIAQCLAGSFTDAETRDASLWGFVAGARAHLLLRRRALPVAASVSPARADS